MLDTMQRKADREWGDVRSAEMWLGRGTEKGRGQHTGYHWVASLRLHTGGCSETGENDYTHTILTLAFITHLVEFCWGKLCWGGLRSSNRSVLLTHPARQHLNVLISPCAAVQTAKKGYVLILWIFFTSKIRKTKVYVRKVESWIH